MPFIITWMDPKNEPIECVTDLDKLNLVKFGNDGLVLGLIQF